MMVNYLIIKHICQGKAGKKGVLEPGQDAQILSRTSIVFGHFGDLTGIGTHHPILQYVIIFYLHFLMLLFIKTRIFRLGSPRGESLDVRS